MPATYGLSTYGQMMLLDEGEEYRTLTPLRGLYLLADLLMYLIPTVIIALQYLEHRSAIVKHRTRSAVAPLWLLTSIFILYVVNNGIRSAHMIDHNYRPVYYHEPKFAYQKYIVTEMELPTYANILIMNNGYFAFKSLLQALFDKKVAENRRWILVNAVLYFIGAFFNLVHYTIEPPSNYGPMPNFNIAGSAITAVPFLAIVLYALFWHPKPAAGGRKAAKESKQLLVDPDTPARSTRARRRSKTPVKGGRT